MSNPPQSSDLANAIGGLTEFLRHGSQRPDPREFDPEQLRIQRDFRDLLAGLGRDRPDRLVNPVLSAGRLRLGAPLPAAAQQIGGYMRDRKKVWLVDVATVTGTPTDLQHAKIVTRDVVRLRVFDSSGREILIGVPTII